MKPIDKFLMAIGFISFGVFLVLLSQRDIDRKIEEAFSEIEIVNGSRCRNVGTFDLASSDSILVTSICPKGDLPR